VVGGDEEDEEVAGGCLGIDYGVLFLCQFLSEPSFIIHHYVVHINIIKPVSSIFLNS
jgi:hypothetical protein